MLNYQRVLTLSNSRELILVATQQEKTSVLAADHRPWIHYLPRQSTQGSLGWCQRKPSRLDQHTLLPHCSEPMTIRRLNDSEFEIKWQDEATGWWYQSRSNSVTGPECMPQSCNQTWKINGKTIWKVAWSLPSETPCGTAIWCVEAR